MNQPIENDGILSDEIQTLFMLIFGIIGIHVLFSRDFFHEKWISESD